MRGLVRVDRLQLNGSGAHNLTVPIVIDASLCDDEEGLNRPVSMIGVQDTLKVTPLA